MADRLSLLLPDMSEVVSFSLGVLLGGFLVCAGLKRLHGSTKGRSDVEVEDKWASLDEGAQKISWLLTDDKTFFPPEQATISHTTSDANMPHDPLDASLPLPSLTDLPPPLRTTIYQQQRNCRPWTSADFVRHPCPPRPQPQSHHPWKRHTLPAMHITDHVQYFPIEEDSIIMDEPLPMSEQSQSSGEPSSIDAENNISQTTPTWRRRRTLTFAPYLPDCGPHPAEDSSHNVLLTGHPELDEPPPPPSSSQHPHTLAPPPSTPECSDIGPSSAIMALQVEIDQYVPADAVL